MYINKYGVLLDEPLTKKDEEYVDLREYFINTPVLPAEQLIFLADSNKDDEESNMYESTIKTIKRHLMLDKYNYKDVFRIFDKTRQMLYNHLKENKIL